jgi:hypothetical protein
MCGRTLPPRTFQKGLKCGQQGRASEHGVAGERGRAVDGLGEDPAGEEVEAREALGDDRQRHQVAERVGQIAPRQLLPLGPVVHGPDPAPDAGLEHDQPVDRQQSAVHRLDEHAERGPGEEVGDPLRPVDDGFRRTDPAEEVHAGLERVHQLHGLRDREEPLGPVDRDVQAGAEADQPVVEPGDHRVAGRYRAEVVPRPHHVGGQTRDQPEGGDRSQQIQRQAPLRPSGVRPEGLEHRDETGIGRPDVGARCRFARQHARHGLIAGAAGRCGSADGSSNA